MARAVWSGETLAESDDYQMVEGNIYFAPDSVKWEYLQDGDREYTCPRKGKAKYHDVVVKGEVNRNAAWGYPDPRPAAEAIRGYLAFGDDVTVQE